MMPGPTIILKCSACGKLIARPTIASGNTFGARFWTDGKRLAPMLPDSPEFVKCGHCSALVWLFELEKVGENGDSLEAPFFDSPPYVIPVKRTFIDAQPYFIPLEGDFHKALACGVADNKKERYLRLRAWWAGNDKRREEGGASLLSGDEIANLEAFCALLDESDENDRITKAEMMRELGNYEEAMVLLSKPFRDEMAQAVETIKKLVVQKIPFVTEMKFLNE